MDPAPETPRDPGVPDEELSMTPPPVVDSLESLPLSGQEPAPPPPLAQEPALPPAPRKKASITFLVIVAGISLVADLGTKWWATSRLATFDTKLHALHKLDVIKGYVAFIFAQNPGGAWSFLRGLPDTIRRPFFLVVSAVALVFIVSIYRKVYDDQRAMKWGLPLALGGAMGNLADRVRYGWVVDFIDMYVVRGGREHHWPTYNIADVAIVIGVALMALDMIRKPREPGTVELSQSASPAPTPSS